MVTILLSVEDMGGRVRYELYATIDHIGTLANGHYTAKIKHFASGKWFIISDEL